MSRFFLLGLIIVVVAVGSAHAQAVRESFQNDPVAAGRFTLRTGGTESAFTFNAQAQALTATLDVDASPAYYLSNPFPSLSDSVDSNFSVRFRVDNLDDQDHPAVFAGLLTDQHVGDFGDGLVMVLSAASGTLVANADIESFDQNFTGSAIPLALHTEYLVMGQFRASARQFAIELFSGTGFTNLVGFSSATLPAGQSFSVNRLGLQNSGARQIDSAVGSITLSVDDFFTPAYNPRALSIGDSTVTEGDVGSTNALFQVQMTPPSGWPITVNFSTSDISATAGSDYIAQSGTLTILPGLTSATISVPVLGDLVHENTETFSVDLSNPIGATLLRGSALGRILDNDIQPLLSVADGSVVEGDSGLTNLAFVVNLSMSSGQTITVDFATADGTASKVTDYVAQAGTLTFQPGETSQRILVPVRGDLELEPDETLLLVLKNPTNAGLLRAQAIGTIFDDDAARRLSINDVAVLEGNSGTTAAIFTVALTRPSTLPISVSYGVVSGTAIVGVDLLASSGTVTFPPGSTTATITVPVVGDTAPELDETFFVRLSDPVNALIAKATGLGTIRNDDPYPVLSIQDSSVLEGDLGTQTALVTVHLSFPIDQSVTVRYATADATAIAPVDYLAQSGTVTFAPGTTEQSIAIAVVGDTLNETNETFLINLFEPTLATISQSQALVTIIDNDPVPVLYVSDVSTVEGDQGSANAVFTLELSALSGQSVSVSYATVDETATAGSDYIERSGTVTFPPGTTTQTVMVPVLGDTIFEPDETFLLRLSKPVNTTLARDGARCTIVNDDPAPTMTINDVTVSEIQGGSTALFTVTLSKPSTQAAVQVDYSTADGTATAGQDYTAQGGTLTFAPGVVQATIAVPVRDDLLYEVDETFFVDLDTPVNAALGKARGQGIIRDNDAPPKMFIRDAEVQEGDSGTTNLGFAVELDKPSGVPVSVTFRTRDGSATASSGDYLAATGQVQFAPGTTTTTINVIVNGDTLTEPDETLFVDLSQPINALEGRFTATGTILDDDARRLVISDAAVKEGPPDSTTNAVFHVTLNKPSTDIITVNYATADGSATANSDYLPTNGTLTFPPGSTALDISVTVVGDNVYEPDETFFVNLTDAVNAVLSHPQGIGRIINDDDALVIVPAGMSVEAEDCLPKNGAIDPGETVTVRLGLANTGTIPSTNLVAKLLSTQGVTPLNAPQSYPQLLPNAPAESRTFTFKADGTCGQSLVATLELQNGGTNFGTVSFPFLLGTNVAGRVVCCQSADIVVTVSGSPNPVVVGHNLTYTVQVSNQGPGVATGLMLTSTWRSAVMVVSSVPSQGVCSSQGASSVCNLGNLEAGASATVQVIVAPEAVGPLIGVFNAKAGEHDPDPNNNTGTTFTTVNAPPGLSISSVAVQEGDSGSTNATFTVRLFPATGLKVTVDYATADGSARAGEDYLPSQGTVTIPPGASSAVILVPVLGDTLPESDETFTVRLSNPSSNAVLASEQTIGTGTILDDDFPVLTLEDAVVTEPASGSANLVLIARLSAPPQRQVMVDFATQDGTAHSPADYTPAAGRLTFAAGVTEANLTLTIVADPLIETDESLFINFTNPVNTRLARGQATVTIVDNNPGSLPVISVSGTSILEGPARVTTNALFKVALSRPSTQPVQVDYATANGSALGGSDFVITGGTVNFAPGQTEAWVPVIVNGDDTPEFDENFFVQLSNPVNGTLGVSRGEGVILNDDYLPLLAPAGTSLLLENCQPFNNAIDPLETVTLNFGLVNRGIGSTTNLTATLRASAHILPSSNPQVYGSLATNAPASWRPFTLAVDGVCGQKYLAELELHDGSYLVGTVPFELTLGTLVNGQPACCASADLSVSVVPTPEPVSMGEPLAYVISITNQGPSLATGLVLTNKLSSPEQFTFTSSGTCTNSADQLVCRLQDLPPGQHILLTNWIAPATLGPLINIVTVGAAQSDPVPANNLAVALSHILPPAGISINDISVVEGNQNHTAQFLVQLWPPHAQTVTVEYELAPGTATADVDYVYDFGLLTFPPGATNANLSVVIIGDSIDEPDETFTATLFNPVNAPIARGEGICTILDDDVPVLTINDTAVNVGTNSTATAVLTVSLSSVSALEVRVDYFTSNGTATAGTDYEPQRGTLVFPPGSIAQVIRLAISGNTFDERQEQFSVQLTSPVNAALDRDTGIVTITDEAPVDLTVSNASVLEGNTGQTNALFSVTLRGAIAHTVSVDFFTSDGTALAGSDYLPVRGTLTFAPGTVENTIAVPVLGDLISEANETFFVNLTNALNGVIRVDRGIGTIVDDDAKPCLSIEDAAVTEGNSGTTNAVLAVRLSGPSSQVVSVEVTVPTCVSSAAPATASKLLMFAPGQTESSLTWPVRGDVIHEPNENCAVVLANPVNADLCRAQAVLTVVDDDPLPGLEINDVSVLEGNAGTSTATFTVTLVGATSQEVTVQFGTSDGTASSASDYVGLSGLLTFPPGMTATNLSISVLGDVELEDDEVFYVNLSNPVNAVIFKGKGTGTILNDDAAPQADCPSLVLLATPGNQTCFEPFAPIRLTATPDVAADKIVQVEFYSGSTLLGVDSSSPFEILWEGAPVGDYCITAKALCASGRAVHSEATCVGVTDSGAAIAIVRNFDDPEIGLIRNYLLEMGYCARVFDQQELSFEALSSFRLVIWDDLGRDGLMDGTVQILGQLFDNGIPIYLVGDRLLSASAQLNPANQSTWANLLRMLPMERSAVPGSIAFSNSIQDRQPGSILSGRFSEISDFVYTNAVDLGTAGANTTALASALSADLLVQYPNVDESDVGQARSVTQLFRVRTGGDDPSVVGRKALFQNVICWLLRCSYCPLVYLTLESSGVPSTINVGDEFTFNLTLGNNGECIASATILTNRLPAGLGLVSASFNQGISTEYHPQDRALVWRVGSVVSGSENNAILAVTVKALQPGLFQNSACAVANYEILNESNCATFDLQIDGTAPVEPPALALLRPASGLYQLRLTGQLGSNYEIQTSSDLLHWLQLTNAPGPLFYLSLPQVQSSSATFYRVR